MTFNLAFAVSFTYTAVVLTFYCNADEHPPPTGLTYEWLDKFIVNVSWKKPSGLPDNRRPIYLVKTKTKACTCLTDGQTSLTESFLTEEVDSGDLTFSIWTVSACNHRNKSTPATIHIYPCKSRAELVKDFKCFVYFKKMDCSWIPVRQDANLTLSFRICPKGSMKCLKKCDQPYSSGERSGCDLNIDTNPKDIDILVETEAAMSTFKPLLVLAPPKLNITEEKDHLKLNWIPPTGGDCWRVEVCYQECNLPQKCQNTTNGKLTMMVPYDKRCLYEFQSKIWATPYCFDSLSSDFSEPVTYGTNRPPDGTLIVAAIAIPIILSISVILSCYCFRKHSAIFCPIIPDPSVIFKEMIMNGNKDLKNTLVSLYTPVPESIETCNITPPTENSVLQQHS